MLPNVFVIKVRREFIANIFEVIFKYLSRINVDDFFGMHSFQSKHGWQTDYLNQLAFTLFVVMSSNSRVNSCMAGQRCARKIFYQPIG